MTCRSLAIAAGCAVFLFPDPGEPVAEVLLGRRCQILEMSVTRRLQDGPQRIDEMQTYEWCSDPPAIWLTRRTFWRIDGVMTRNERTDTPASESTVLWWEADPGKRGPPAPPTQP